MSADNGKKATGLRRQKGEGRHVRGHLTLVQQIALADAMKANRERFMTERPTLYQAATILTVAAGFAVTKANVASMRDALGISWKSRPKGRSRAAREDALRVVGEAVAALYTRLGGDPPYELLSLLTGMEAAAAVAEDQE